MVRHLWRGRALQSEAGVGIRRAASGTRKGQTGAAAEPALRSLGAEPWLHHGLSSRPPREWRPVYAWSAVACDGVGAFERGRPSRTPAAVHESGGIDSNARNGSPLSWRALRGRG